MNSVPREKLRELIGRYGLELGDDARRCEALLRDLCGSHKKEIFVLVSAIRERIPADLLAGASGAAQSVLAARLEKRLQDNLGLSPSMCQWAVESWGFALGVLSVSDIPLKFDCPQCSRKLQAPANIRGKPMRCPRCKAVLSMDADGVPRAKPTEPPPLPTIGRARSAGTEELVPESDVFLVPESEGSESVESLFRHMVSGAVVQGRVQAEKTQALEQARQMLGLPVEAARRIVDEVLRSPPLQAAAKPTLTPSTSPTVVVPASPAPTLLPPTAGEFAINTVSVSDAKTKARSYYRYYSQKKLLWPVIATAAVGVAMLLFGLHFIVVLSENTTFSIDDLYYVLFCLVHIPFGLLICAGAAQIYYLRNYLLAMVTAGTVFVIPTCSCAFVNVLIAAWLLTTLLDPHVRESFDR